MARAAEEYGYHMGLAFQIVDDILDIVGAADVSSVPSVRSPGIVCLTPNASFYFCSFFFFLFVFDFFHDSFRDLVCFLFFVVLVAFGRPVLSLSFFLFLLVFSFRRLFFW